MLQTSWRAVSCLWYSSRFRAWDKEHSWMLLSKCYRCHLPVWQQPPQKAVRLFCFLTLA